LQFLCIWDDTANLYGDVMEYTLIYHLCDDTIEIFASAPNNSGREQFPRLLKRAKLPKDFGVKNFEENLSSKSSLQAHYHWTDISIGFEIMVYSRNLVVVDADQATRNFYEQNQMELGPSQRPGAYKPNRTARTVPPHNGFGSEEDSLQSCVGPLLNTSPPKKKHGENKVLSFVCELSSNRKEDEGRRFVLTYYVTDTTIKVHEIPAKNSGFVGGVFLSRGKYKNPENEYVTDKDIFIGATVILQRHGFHILQSNENTLQWMETHSESLPKSNFNLIMDKLRSIDRIYDDIMSGKFLDKLKRLDNTSSGKICKDALIQVLQEYDVFRVGESTFCEHEVLTIVRAFGEKGEEFDYCKFVKELVEPGDDDL